MNKNAWRWSLDPRDPDYDDPPTEEEEPADPVDDFDDTDPRGHGPMNYCPPGDR
jgi:hypothetical protein